VPFHRCSSETEVVKQLASFPRKISQRDPRITRAVRIFENSEDGSSSHKSPRTPFNEAVFNSLPHLTGRHKGSGTLRRFAEGAS
jgi:hypothetical protein